MESNSKKRMIIGVIIAIILGLAIIFIPKLTDSNKEENKNKNTYNNSLINEGVQRGNMSNEENGEKPTVIPDEPTVEAPTDITQIPMDYNEEFESVNTNN